MHTRTHSYTTTYAHAYARCDVTHPLAAAAALLAFGVIARDENRNLGVAHDVVRGGPQPHRLDPCAHAPPASVSCKGSMLT